MKRGLIIACFVAALSGQTIQDTAPRTLVSAPYARLGTPPNGTIMYCTDCTKAAPTAPGGTGATVARENGVWNGSGGGGGGGAAVAGADGDVQVKSGVALGVVPGFTYKTGILGVPPLSATFVNPPSGGSDEHRSLEWSQGNDGTTVGCPTWGAQCFPNVDMWYLNASHIHGMQDYTNAAKTSTNVLLMRLWGIGAGQRGNLGVQSTIVGVGDAQGINVQVTGGSTNSAGDEGTHGLRVEMNGERSPYKVTLPAQPAQTTCASGAMTLTAAIVPGMAAQAIAVTGSTAGCNVGDHLIISRQTPITGSSTEEMIVLTAVSGSALTAVVRQAHAAGSTINAATKVFVANANGFGQFRWVVNDTRAYSTGTISSVSGTAFQGSGTSWGSQTVFAGDSITPCLISLDGDTNTGIARIPPGLDLRVPANRLATLSAAGMRSWFFCNSINTSTQAINITTTYPGFTNSGGTYQASCGAVVMGFDNPVNYTDYAGVNIYIDIPPSLTCFRAGDTMEQTTPVQGSVGGLQIHCGTYAKGSPLSCAGIGINNYGDNEGNLGIAIGGPGFKWPDPDHPAFRYALQIGSPVEYGLVFTGIKNTMVGTTTFSGYPGPISWGAATGLGNASLKPDTDTGNFLLGTHSGKFMFYGVAAGSDGGAILDFSGATAGNITLKVPNNPGVSTLLTDRDVPGTKLTKTLAAAANSFVVLGGWAGDNVYEPRVFDVIVSGSDGSSKRYSFAQAHPSAHQFEWPRVPPLTEELPTASTDRWDLEFGEDDGSGIGDKLRIRRTAGSNSVDFIITVLCYSGRPTGCTYTPITATGTSGPWGSTMSSAVLTQANGTATINGKLALASVAPYTCDASAAGHFNYIAGAAGTKDTVQVCAKDSSDVFAWRPIY